MNKRSKISTAEFTENFQRSIAIAMLLMSFAYVSSAAEYIVSEQTGYILDKFEMGIAIIVMLIILPKFLLSVGKLSKGQRRSCFEAEGYVAHMFKRACAKAFEFTFIVLIAMDVISGKYLTDLPSDFFIKIVLAISMAIFALTFFYFNRGENEDEFDEESVV